MLLPHPTAPKDDPPALASREAHPMRGTGPFPHKMQPQAGSWLTELPAPLRTLSEGRRVEGVGLISSDLNREPEPIRTGLWCRSDGCTAHGWQPLRTLAACHRAPVRRSIPRHLLRGTTRRYQMACGWRFADDGEQRKQQHGLCNDAYSTILSP